MTEGEDLGTIRSRNKMRNKASWEFEWSNLNRRRTLGSRVKIIYKTNNSTSTTWGYLLSNWKAMLGLKMIQVLELHTLLSWLWVSQMFYEWIIYHLCSFHFLARISCHFPAATTYGFPLCSERNPESLPGLQASWLLFQLTLCSSEIQFPPQDPCTWWSWGLDHFPLSPHYCLI